MLEGQCDVWSGVISAAVYIALVRGRAVIVELNSNQDPMLAPLDLVEQRFREFHDMAEGKGALRLGEQGAGVGRCGAAGWQCPLLHTWAAAGLPCLNSLPPTSKLLCRAGPAAVPPGSAGRPPG